MGISPDSGPYCRGTLPFIRLSMTGIQVGILDSGEKNNHARGIRLEDFIPAVHYTLDDRMRNLEP